MISFLKKSTDFPQKNCSSGIHSAGNIFKFALIISCDNIAANNIQESLMATFASIENQNFDIKKDIQFFIVLPDKKEAVKAAEKFKKEYLPNSRIIFADSIPSKIYSSILDTSAEYISVVNAGDGYTKRTFKAVYNYFNSVESNVDAVGIKIENQSDIYNKYNEVFSKKSKTVKLSERPKAFPRELSCLFIKSDIAKEKIKLQKQNCFNSHMFIIDILENNACFAAVKSAGIHIKQGDKTVFFPEMFNNHISRLFAHINRIYNEIGFIPAYVQNYIMAEIMKMINNSENIMEGYNQVHYDYSDMWDKLSVLLSFVADQIIFIYETSRFNKLLLLKIKHKKNCSIAEIENEAVIFFNNMPLYNLSEFTAKIELVSIENGSLIIEGACRYPSCINPEKAKVRAEINGKLIDIEQIKRFTDKYYYEKAYIYEKGFKIVIPLKLETYKIKLVTEYENKHWYHNDLKYMSISSVGFEVEGSYYYKSGYVITAKDSFLTCSACSKARRQELEAKFRKEIKAAEPRRYNKITAIRDYYFKNAGSKKKQIWLIMDRPDRADDNAEAFFRYMIKRNEPDIDLYFIISRKSEAFNELSRIGKVIEPFSEEHKKLFTVADYMISSQMAEATINPFDKDLKYFRDLFRNPKQIFLQHGVIHNDHGSTLNKYRRDFYGFITSASAEYNYLLSPKFHYTENEMWLTGMPRFDRLYRDDKKKITIMPTWRKFLTTRCYDEASGTMIWKVNEDFVDSEYFIFYNNLINSERLLDAADKYGYKICFMPHVIFLKETDKFTHNGRTVIYNYEKSYREIYAESSLIVTDYSSAVFDFSYLRQPIIYSQFDFEKFYSDHTVKKGYFNFKRDGFGEVTDDIDDTIDLIIDYMSHNCELKPKYRERIDKFFTFSDKKCSERIYNRIKEKEACGNRFS